ncbi:ESPR-type extended signal peptide-containing protein [Veillonella sp. 20925_1_51]|uniref:ESPR-type extended signal peptide-containing protein n=1 Tax=Veillonella sp. 20925_1_51 TaxID=3003641 RepID=UPI00352CC6C3
MNKIFKVVWSKSKECYVVVSEVAKNNGGKKKVLASVLAGLAMVGVAAQMGTPVQAGANNSGNAVNLWADKKLDGSNNTANTVGANSVAVGNNLVAGSASTTPTGRLGGTAIAIGVDSQAKDDRNIAIGYNNTTEGQDSVAMGSNVIAGTGQSIAIGSTNTDDNGVQTQTIARGKVTMKNGRPEPAAAIAIGSGAQALDGSGVLAMGQLSYAKGNNDVAIGTQTKVIGNNSTAIGSTAQALGNSSAAYGTQAIANGLGATAVGPGASAGTGADAAAGATAVGRGAKATKEGASALGWAANASVENAAAIGRDTTANIEGGVALGYQSVTTTAAGVQGYNPASDRTNKYSAQAGAIGTSTLAAVSVGNGLTATRQITGLAAGTADTDAVNVAQLKNVNLKYAGDTGNSDVLLKDGTLNVKGDTKLISTSADATGITVTAKVGDNITANAAGKAVAPTTNGIATTDNVTQAINNSGWNVTSLNNGGTTNGTTSEKVSPGDTVTFSAGKNIVLDQAGKQFTYSLSSTLKDIQSIQNGASKITLNNAGGTTISGGNLSVDGNKITKVAQGTDGTDAVNVDQLNAVAAKERHVKPGNYAVDGNGTVTLNYVDGNNADVADTAVISGIAKDDLSNITNAGKKVITGLGSKVEAGDNVTVTDTTDGTTGQKTYTVSANLTKVTDGTNTTVTGAGTTANPYKVNVAGDLTGITSIANTAGGPTMTIGGNSINVTGGNLDLGSNKITNLAPGTNDTDAVNYKQLKTAKTVVEAGTNVSVNKTLGANGEDVYTVSATAGGTASTESVVKKAAATGDTNIADVSVAGGKNVNDPGAQYEVSVSKNAVKDAAREAVTVNNGGNTDNPITVTPTDDAANHNTTYAVTFDGDKAAKQIPLTYKANGSGDKTVKLDKGLDFTNGTNTTAEIGNDGVVKFNLKDNVALTNAGSLTVGDTKVNNDGLTISGGPSVTKNGIDAGNQKITNVAPGTISSTSTDAVNGSQLYDVDQKFNNTVKLTGNAGATDGQALNKANGLSFGVIGADNGKYISTSANGSDVTVDLSTDAKKLLNNTVEVKGKNAATVTTSTETTADGGTKTIYTVDVASTGTVAKSSWNIKSSADTANGGAEATGHEAAAKNIADTNTVEMVAGKNLTVKQTSDTDGAKVEYALNKDLKDLTSVTTEKVTTKEIGLQDPTGKVTTIKNDGDRITYTKDGDTKVHKVATLDDEKHIKPGSYAVQNDGSVTMTYVDGNGDPVANDEAKITGIAKQDLSNITDAGKNVITGLGTIVKAGDNVTVSEASDATTGQKTYTVNAVTPAVYTKADGTKVVKRPDGTFTTNVDGAPGNDVPASDVIVSIQDAAGNTIGGNSIVNNVGSAIDKTGTSTGNTFLNKLDTAANDTPNAAVNVKDLKNTSDAIIGKGLKFDANDGGEKTNKLGSKVTVKGEGTKANTEYSGTNIKTIIAQTGDDTTIDVKLAKDLTGINSISNTAAGPKMEFGGNSINITGGNLDLGSNKITNLGPATAGSDAVNYDQLKNSRTEVKSSDGSVTVTPTTAGDKTTYDLKVATTGTVAKSTWNIASDKVSATEGTVAAGSGAAQNIADTKTVTMQAGKNLTVNQTNDGNGNASVAFALDKDLKDLTSVTTEKVTTKEIGLQDPTGKVTTIKNDGDRITYTKDGDTKVHKVATLDDEKHIKPGSYAVQNDGSVTMTYVDGNGDPVANTEAKITGIAKQDLSNIDNAGKNVITGLGTIVKAGDNVTVSEASNATTGQKTYTVNAVTPAVYTKADGTKVVKRPDGTFTTNVDGAPGNDVPASDVIVSIQDAAGNTIGGNSIVNNVGSAIDKTGTSTGNTFLTNLNNAATDNPFAAVNVRDLKSTADALKASELHIAPTSVVTGSTEVVGGTASGNTNPGAATQAYKYNATTKQVELTFNDGNGKAVNGPKAVIDFSDLNTGGTAASSWNIKSSANTTDGGAIGDNHDAAAQNIADNKTVEFQAGKNLVVKQTNDAANGNATVEFSLSDNITAGKDGANGKDGSVGATGKDGSSVVLNGKDGSIGMTGPKGQDGKDGINGRDGADISITSAKGEQVLVNRDPAHNGDTDKAERIVYVPKDANGNPIQGADGKNIVREVATMDDGLRFTGNNTSTENKQKLGSLVKVEGEGVTEAQANSFQSATGNIAVVADGADKLTVKLNKDLKGLDSVTTKEVKLGDANDNISIKKAGDRITYTTPGSTDTHKVATLDDEMHIKDTTYTVDGNKKVTMTYVDGNGNPVAGKTAVIDLSGLPVGETDTDMRIKEGTYTAQNGKVTLNTVDKGGNPVTGKDVVIDGINTNNYIAGDNVTLTPDTDAAGKPVVKINAALSTEKVVKKAGADNLATVSTASGNVAGDKGETYEVAVTKGDIENNAEISYKASTSADAGSQTAKKTTLANGFDFTSDDNSVAITTGANGKVNFKVDTTNIQGKAFNLDVNKEGTGKVEDAKTVATTNSVEKGTKFVAGNNLSIRHDAINSDAKYDHQVTYALNSDLKGITSITNNGGATMNFGPNEVSITGGNLNMGGSKITNVKNGTDKSDVATVGQLTKVTSNDNTVAINKTTDAEGAPVYDLSVQGGGHDPRVDQLGEEIGRVGAQGAALAALKPIQYDPLEPTQIMAGYGNYRGNSAIAMGVAHYKNESTLMHAGVSWAGGSRHMMANAGVTWKVGNRDSEAAVADRYRKGPISSAYAMQQEMASVKAQNAGLKTEVSDLKAENEQMKAQIAAMMAKLGM